MSTAAVLGLSLLGMAPANADPPAASSRDAGTVKIVGTLPVLSPAARRASDGKWNVNDVDLVLSPKRRRAYQIFNTEGRGPTLQAFDLDSLRPLGSVTGLLSHAVPTGGGSNYILEHWHTVDEEAGRLFLAVHQPGTSARVEHKVFVFDLDAVDRGDAGALAAVIQTPVEMPQLDFGLIKGMSLFRDDSGRQKILLYFMRAPPPSMITQWDVERAIQAARQNRRDGYGDWVYVLASNCGGTTLTTGTNVPIFRSSDGSSVYTVCHIGRGFVNLSPVLPGLTLAAVRIPLGVGGLPRQDQEEVFPGPANVHATLADPDADRISMVAEATATGSGTGQSLWTFDGRASRFVGNVGLATGPFSGQSSTYGLDASSGRIYALVPNQRVRQGSVDDRYFTVAGGLLLVDARLTPVPQALSFPEFAHPSQPSIRIDPATKTRGRRIFIRYAAAIEPQKGATNVQGDGVQDCDFYHPSQGTGVQTDRRRRCTIDQPFYLVLEETVPVATTPALRELDRFTANVQEREGITGSNFEGVSSAYGARIRLVGGFRENAASVCAPDEREITLGFVEEARLSNLDTAARAIGSSMDQTTRLDLSQPTQRCADRSGSPFAEIDRSVGREYPIESVECAGDRKTETSYGDLPGASEVSATVECAQQEQWVKGLAGTTAVRAAALTPDEADPLSPTIGSVSTSVEAFRDPVRGIVVRAESVVRDVEIPLPEGEGAPVRISLAKSTMEVWSNGRPSAGLRTQFERVICGFGAADVSESGCYKSQDDEQFGSLIADVNRRFGGRISVRIPQPDPDLLRGSPGGYVAGVQKSAADQVDDRLLNGDSSLEVPAIEIVRYADTDDAKVRQIIRLAGVRGTTTYGIFVLPQGGGFPFDPVIPGPQLPPIVPPVVVDPDGPAGPIVGEQPTDGRSFVPGGGPVVFGLRVRPIGETALGAIVWLALALPFYLAWRRDWLIRWFGREAG